ncbi:putative zinc-type alcohol dehydrogenase-like protein YjmD [bacterium BMS3Abin05]|nr:putative zinc-type alcohol dehydrogenase-like protein YjmD [bacterium BMS3Abin05]GBE28245.1 putative zinc-type alcohol dehydrogenase-like protein YjmD [bacterium BMS3Bbin03]HDZ11228.1 alcohol dehydrogenase [Bacteroidota bacterium]
MYAAIFKRKHEIELLETKIPAVKEDEVLVEIQACGVCGTDRHIFEGDAPAAFPVIPGHEFCGVVREIGKRVKTTGKEDYVAVDPNIYCGTCQFCKRGKVQYCENLQAVGVTKNGGFAQFCSIPETQVYKLDKAIPVNWGTQAEPLSCAIHGMNRSPVHSGDKVLIIGAGNIGLIMLQLARMSPASRIGIIEPIEARRTAAHRYGCDDVFDSSQENLIEAVKTSTNGGADLVIECVGKKETVELGLSLLKPGGRLLIFGLGSRKDIFKVGLQEIFYRELTIIGSLLNPFSFQSAVTLLNSGKIHFNYYKFKEYQLARISDAFRHHRSSAYHKIILKPNSLQPAG